MKRWILLAAGLGLGLLAPSASAQVAPGLTNIADRVGKVILPGQGPLDSSPTTVVSRPPRLERPDLPQEIKVRIAQFAKSRETYLAREQELKRKLQGATDDDRARIRAQLQALRDEWLERARALREDPRARLQELQDELPRYRDALRDAKEGALDSINSTRKRRGGE